MNLGIIAHNSKKVLIEDSASLIRIYLPNMRSMPQVQPDGE